MMSPKKIKWRIIAASIAIALASLWCVRLMLMMGVQRQLIAIQQGGLPTTGVELDQWYEMVPDRENAALLVWEAMREHRDNASVAKLMQVKREEVLSPEKQEAIKGYLEKNRAAVEKLHGAADLPGSRYPLDLTKGPDILLPHLSSVKKLAFLLKLEAIEQSARGNREAAVRAVSSGFGLARTLRNEPILISELIRTACVAFTIEGLERVISEHQLTEQELARLSSWLREAEADGAHGLARGFAGERAISMIVFQMRLRELQRFTGVFDDESAMLQALRFGVGPLTGMKERDQAVYLETMEEFVQAATNQFPELIVASRDAEARMNARLKTGAGRFALVSRMLIPGLSTAVKKEAFLAAELRCAQVALAIERYRIEHSGRLPEELDHLAGEYLAEVPRDPFDDQPLVYEKRKKGYRIVSGEASVERKRTQKQDGDVEFSVER